ncbi:MAG: LacI family transcriptional regulator [Clostridiales bacterium]|nr:LacI family transcriptional regulator [Clostridiales bacterium]
MVTIRDIARACGVSIATVSNVLNGKKNVSDEMRARVMEKVREMNYTPNSIAKNLKTKKTRTLGIIVEDITIFSIPDLVDGITECCEVNNYRVTLINLRLFQKFDDVYYHQEVYREQVQEVLRILLADQVEAIIYIAAHERIIHCLPSNFPIPLIMCYACTTAPGIPSLLVEETTPTEQLIQYAIDQGHRRIGVITGKRDSVHSQQRMMAYRQTLIRNDIPYDPSLLCVGDWTRESGIRYTDQLLAQGATAIFCMNDLMAGGVYARLKELGLTVGKDVGVMGYDNRLLSEYLDPPLTTVALPLHELGCRAGEIALEALSAEHAPPPAHIYVAGKVILRGSVQKIEPSPA